MSLPAPAAVPGSHSFRNFLAALMRDKPDRTSLGSGHHCFSRVLSEGQRLPVEGGRGARLSPKEHGVYSTLANHRPHRPIRGCAGNYASQGDTKKEAACLRVSRRRLQCDYRVKDVSLFQFLQRKSSIPARMGALPGFSM